VIPSLRTRGIVAAVVFVVALAVYVRTLAPTVVLNDSGELTLAVWGLGNAHPPGSPVFLLATHPSVWLPLKSVAWRTNFASAFFAALGAALMAMAAFEIAIGKRRDASIAVALFAGLAAAFSKTLWNYATVTEVYALTVALLAGALFALLAWRRTRNVKILAVAALLFGLAMGVHYVLTLLTGLAGLVLVIASRVKPRELAIGTGALLLALTAYAYLPIRASMDVPFDWGDPSTASRFVDHVTARQYRGYIDPEHAKADFPLLVAVYRRDLGTWSAIVVLLIAGVYSLARHDRALLVAMLSVVALNLLWMRLYWIVNDRDAYLLPMILATVLVAARGVHQIASHFGRAGVIVASIALLFPYLAARAAYPERDRSGYRVAESYALDAIDAMAPNALLLIGDWQLRSPLMYFLGVEKRRPDVTMIDVGEVSHSWYLDEIERQHPALLAAVKPHLDAFRAMVVRREHMPIPEWDAQRPLHEEYVRLLTNLLVSMSEHQIRGGGHVYATFDIPENIDIAVGPTHMLLAQKYPVVPRRVLIEYAAKPVEDPRPPVLRDEGLRPPIEAGDARGHLMRIYRDAYLNYARRYAVTRRPAEAQQLFDRAKLLDTSGEAFRLEQVMMRVANRP
jgi:Protein of unknown function (DUF2723)